MHVSCNKCKIEDILEFSKNPDEVFLEFLTRFDKGLVTEKGLTDGLTDEGIIRSEKEIKEMIGKTNPEKFIEKILFSKKDFISDYKILKNSEPKMGCKVNELGLDEDFIFDEAEARRLPSGQIDMSISKFSPDGSSLIYSTYIGGSGLEAPHSMIVNDQNELIIYGVTSSLDYPTSSNAYDKTFNGGTSVSASNVLDYLNGTDIAITKLSKLGNQIIGSTYYGGSANDALNDANGSEDLFHNYADIYRGEVNIDEANNIYISSVTSSTNLPTPNGFQTNYGGGVQDGCVAKFNNDLSGLVWGSYFGGSGADACYASKRNSKGETYITGGTNSINLTSINNGFQPNYSNNVDGFLARIAPNGGSITAATYVGTNSYDQSYFVEVDHEDKIYCYGQSSGTMPTTSGVYKNDNSHQFL